VPNARRPDSSDANPDEVAQLRRVLADLVSVLALPVMWAGSEPRRIAQVLVDSLAGMLDLEAVYVWLAGGESEAPIELRRTTLAVDLPGVLAARLGEDRARWPDQAWSPIRDAGLSLLPLALGLRGEHGVLVIGSTRGGFPTESELLILRVAANQAAMGLKEARVQKELSRSVKYREQLMGILGHDLRSPLSAVTGLSGLLRLDPGLSPRAKESLARIQQAGSRMSEMIETILDFTRIRFGDAALPIVRGEMDVAELCRDLVTEALAVDPTRAISLEVSGEPRGKWDRARLAQVVANLIQNALTHGDAAQGIRVIVTGDASAVSLAVENRGPTIPADRIAALFEPFVQGSAGALARKRSGLGLGLYIAKQVVSSHGGTLTAVSHDETTTFRMILPR